MPKVTLKSLQARVAELELELQTNRDYWVNQLRIAKEDAMAAKDNLSKASADVERIRSSANMMRDRFKAEIATALLDNATLRGYLTRALEDDAVREQTNIETRQVETPPTVATRTVPRRGPGALHEARIYMGGSLDGEYGSGHSNRSAPAPKPWYLL